MISSTFRNRILFGLARCLLVLSPLGVAQAKPDPLAALESAVRKETEKVKPGDDFEDGEQPRSVATRMLGRLRDAVNRNDPRQADAVLAEITALFKSDAVRSAVGKLREEQAAKENESLAKISGVLASAATAVKNARKPADLDAAIRDLRNFPGYQEPLSQQIRNELQKVQTARQFVLYWQDYLAAQAVGDWQRALQGLQSASGVSTDLMERSQILSRIDEVSKRKSPDQEGQARQIMAKVKSLDDIPAALAALAALEPRPGAGDFQCLIPTLRLELSRISQVYREYQAGLPTSIQVRGFDGPAANEETFGLVLPLKVQLLHTIVARALEVDEKLKPGPDEPIRAYVDRIAALAFEKGEIRLFIRARELRNKLDGIVLSSANISITQSLLAGLNQEEAGQWAAAVVSYETALKYGGDVVPAKHIGTRLEGIKAAHPKEFEQGFERFMSGFQPIPQNQNPGGTDKIVIPEAPEKSVSPTPKPPSSPR